MNFCEFLNIQIHEISDNKTCDRMWKVVSNPPNEIHRLAMCIEIPCSSCRCMTQTCLKSPASRLFTQTFIQTQIKENIKAPRHWPLWGEFTGTGEFPAQRASYAEIVSVWWRHHDISAEGHWWSLLSGNPIGLVWSRQHIWHYCDVIMGAMASQITSLTIVCSTVHSGADQRKHQSPASLAIVLGIHRSPVNSTHKWPVTRKMFPFDDVIMVTG